MSKSQKNEDTNSENTEQGQAEQPMSEEQISEAVENIAQSIEEAKQAEDNKQADASNSPQGDAQQLKEENAKLKEQLLRAMADAENTRKRASRDVEEASKYGSVSLARDLISVLENLHRAEESIPAEEAKEDAKLHNILEGITMTRKELAGVFEKHGIQRIFPEGEPFDHNFHQAVANVENADQPPGTVLDVMQAGYVMKERLLRPAMVCVTKAPEGK